MRKIILGLLAVVLLGSAVSDAQLVPFPQSLPPNTVVGRTGISAGPAQAIPFSVFRQVVLNSTQCLNITSAPFNGVGDNTTDNVTPLTAALQALSGTGGCIFFPPGKYKF